MVSTGPAAPCGPASVVARVRRASWELLVVLAALTEEAFEPLCRATPKDLPLKALFPVAAASALRVCEMHALCINPPFLIQNPRSFHLAPNPEFLPKTPMEVVLFSELELTTFYSKPTSPLERGLHFISLVYVLHIYLQCMAHPHGPLFGHWEEGRTHRPVPKC